MVNYYSSYFRSAYILGFQLVELWGKLLNSYELTVSSIILAPPGGCLECLLAKLMLKCRSWETLLHEGGKTVSPLLMYRERLQNPSNFHS